MENILTVKEAKKLTGAKSITKSTKCGTCRAYICELFRIVNYKGEVRYVIVTRQGLTDFVISGSLVAAYEGKEGVHKKTYKSVSAAVKYYNAA